MRTPRIKIRPSLRGLWFFEEGIDVARGLALPAVESREDPLSERRWVLISWRTLLSYGY